LRREIQTLADARKRFRPRFREAYFARSENASPKEAAQSGGLQLLGLLNEIAIRQHGEPVWP
jgi:hypothetical protein